MKIFCLLYVNDNKKMVRIFTLQKGEAAAGIFHVTGFRTTGYSFELDIWALFIWKTRSW